MKTLKKMNPYKMHFILILCTSVYFEQIVQDHVTETLPAISYTSQQIQARELLTSSKDIDTLSSHFTSEKVLHFVRTQLPRPYRNKSDAIARSIIIEAKANKLDPLFLMAVIQTESGFNPEARGRHGEIGLMQILPKTATWLARKFHIKGPVDLTQPETNIKLGAAYLAKLRARFHQVGNRYIAAYNMGAKNVKRLVASQIEPKLYSERVLNNYRSIYQKMAPKDNQPAVASL